ncbi:hypothetical protein Hanom_Chr09g00855821 [Helianthus anomalus]
MFIVVKLWYGLMHLCEVFGTIPLQVPPVQCCSYTSKWCTGLYKNGVCAFCFVKFWRELWRIFLWKVIDGGEYINPFGVYFSLFVLRIPLGFPNFSLKKTYRYFSLMSSVEHHEDSSEEMYAGRPPLKWSKEVFDDLVQSFKFPDSWGDYFTEGNFRLPVTRLFLDILAHYKFHISQLHPIGMVRVRHFKFLCRSMYIESTVNRFRVLYQMHCSQGFYSFAQRSSAKKILLHPPKSFHDWKPKFFFIKAGTIQTPHSETWYQDLKDVLSIELPERAIAAAGISLYWKMDREDKPVYMEGDKIVSLYVVAYGRENGRMATILKRADKELWYL